MSRRFNARLAGGLARCLLLPCCSLVLPSILLAQQTTKPAAMYVINGDGTGWHKVLELPGFAGLGSPETSPDGRFVAFDAWQEESGESSADAHVFVAALDGSRIIDLGDGAMPSWSADGRYVVCSRYSPNHGIWIMSVEENNIEELDPRGWGAEWSPDGKTISWTRGREIVLYDVATTDSRIVSLPGINDYRQVYWNSRWSPDSNQLCVLLLKPDETRDIAIFSVDDPQETFRIRYNGPSIRSDFSWHSSGDRIAVVIRSPEHRRPQLFEFDPATDESPVLFPGQDETRQNVGMCWFRDGSRILVVSRGP